MGHPETLAVQFGAPAESDQLDAFLQHRGFVTPDDVRAMGMDVLRHRVLVTYEAEAEEVTPEDIVRRILDSVEVPSAPER